MSVFINIDIECDNCTSKIFANSITDTDECYCDNCYDSLASENDELKRQVKDLENQLSAYI